MTPIDPVVALILRCSLALLLLSAAWHKLRDVAAFVAAVAAYALVPQRWHRAVAWGLVFAEGAIGVSLAIGVGVAPLAAAALLASYTVAIATNLARGRRDIDCGCAGPARRMPLNTGLVVRNAILIVAVGCAAIPTVARPLVWLDALTVTAAVLVLALLYGAVNTALVNAMRLQPLRCDAVADPFELDVAPELP
jgi:uncharacterized membrane protein YphA (DoxX/SURF4 family)